MSLFVNYSTFSHLQYSVNVVFNRLNQRVGEFLEAFSWMVLLNESLNPYPYPHMVQPWCRPPLVRSRSRRQGAQGLSAVCTNINNEPNLTKVKWLRTTSLSTLKTMETEILKACLRFLRLNVHIKNQTVPNTARLLCIWTMSCGKIAQTKNSWSLRYLTTSNPSYTFDCLIELWMRQYF